MDGLLSSRILGIAKGDSYKGSRLKPGAPGTCASVFKDAGNKNIFDRLTDQAVAEKRRHVPQQRKCRNSCHCREPTGEVYALTLGLVSFAVRVSDLKFKRTSE